MAQPDFVEVYPQALAPETCAQLIADFERSGAAIPGRVGGGVLPALKDSRDIEISARPEWSAAESALNTAMFAGALQYLRKYCYALLAPLMLQVPDLRTGQTRLLNREDFATMSDAQLGKLVHAVLRPGTINLQRYTAGEGGYPYWHCEICPRDSSCDTLHRTLLWTIYLNDRFQGGETEFLYQERKIRPETGTLLIAPAAFTHTHRGNRPIGGHKYIATSWLLFRRAEALFGATGAGAAENPAQ
jgi:hypothetical protein